MLALTVFVLPFTAFAFPLETFVSVVYGCLKTFTRHLRLLLCRHTFISFQPNDFGFCLSGNINDKENAKSKSNNHCGRESSATIPDLLPVTARFKSDRQPVSNLVAG